MDTLEKDLSISFYDDYGELSVYAKQYDTQRVINFQFVDDVIPDDTSNFHILVRGKYSSGIIFLPYEIDTDYITSENITFNVPSYILSVPGMTKCDLVLCTADGDIEINPDTGEITNEIEVLSTHNFNIYVEELPTAGGSYSSEEQESVDVITQLIIRGEAVIADLEDYEDKIIQSTTWEVI
jgi:hypothetical protein